MLRANPIQPVAPADATILNDPAALELFAWLHCRLSGGELVEAAVRIEAERLASACGIPLAAANVEVLRRLADDPAGVVVAAMSGDDESDLYLARTLAEIARRTGRKPYGRTN